MEKIIVSRKWNNPEIKVFMEITDVGASISIDDFIEAIVQEIGNPTSMLTKQMLKKKIITASSVVIKELKDKTVHL